MFANFLVGVVVVHLQLSESGFLHWLCFFTFAVVFEDSFTPIRTRLLSKFRGDWCGNTLKFKCISSRNFVFGRLRLHRTFLLIEVLRSLVKLTWSCISCSHLLPHFLCKRTILASKCKHLFSFCFLLFLLICLLEQIMQ